MSRENKQRADIWVFFSVRSGGEDNNGAQCIGVGTNLVQLERLYAHSLSLSGHVNFGVVLK
jgi:hypothetical protein